MKRYFNSLWVFNNSDDLLNFINLWNQGEQELPGEPLELPLEFQLDDLESVLGGRADILPVVAVECWHGSEISVTPVSLEIWDTFQDENDGEFAAVLLDKMFYVDSEGVKNVH